MMRNRYARLVLVLLTAAVGVLLAAPAFAQMPQLFEDFGVAPRDAAMGNTGTAAADDYAAAFYNPAALARARGFGLHVGYKLVDPNLYLKIGRYDSRHFTQYPYTNYFLFGITWNMVAPSLIDPKWTERFTFGMAVALSDYYKSFAIPYDPDSPYFYRYHDRSLNLLSAYLSLSCRITDWLSIGGGLVPAPSITFSRADVDAHIYVPDYKYRATQGTVTRSWGRVEPLAGLLFRLPREGGGDVFSFGVVWRDEVVTIDGNGTATARMKVHFNGQTLYMPPSDTPMQTLTGWTPMQVVAGLAVHPTPELTLSVEELWKRWSGWQNFFSDHPDPPFHDTWNTRFGAEYVFSPGWWALQTIAPRAGVYRELSPAPDQNGQNNYLDPNKWVFTAGFDSGWLLPNVDVFRVPVHFEVAGQLHVMDRVELNNDRDPDYPPLDAWGNVYSLTATLGFGEP